jgi:iron-sulfur cluster repair protein YtfE (RIC family)
MYQAPHLTSEVMVFAQEHEKSMQDAHKLQQLLSGLGGITSPLDQAERIKSFMQLEQQIGKELEPHFYNEEEALFPILGKHIGFETGLIPDIRNEHEKLRTFFQELRQAIHHLRNQWTNEHVEQLNGIALNFISYLQGHIYKEDHELFPLMEQTLSLEEKREVFAKLYANVQPIQLK